MANAVQKTQSNKVNELKSFLESSQVKTAIMKALPKFLTIDKFLGIVLSEVRNTPKLLECDQISFVNAVVQCSQMGLVPGNGLGQAYLIPRKSECTFMPGYRGYIVAARRSKPKTIITAHCVFENDEKYECLYGSAEKIIHIPTLQNRGKIIGAYAIARDEDGGEILDQLNMEDIEKARNASPAGSSDYSPWKTFYNEMARKTAVRRLSKYLDLSPEFNALRDFDNNIDAGKIIEGEFKTESAKPKPQNKAMLEKLRKEEELQKTNEAIFSD